MSEYKIIPKKCKHCVYKTNSCFNRNKIKCIVGNIKNKFVKKGINNLGKTTHAI